MGPRQAPSIEKRLGISVEPLMGFGLLRALHVCERIGLDFFVPRGSTFDFSGSLRYNQSSTSGSLALTRGF